MTSSSAAAAPADRLTAGPLRVGQLPAGAAGELHRIILSSLPSHLVESPGRGDVVLVDGSAPDWAGQLTQVVTEGARGVLLAVAGVTAGPAEVAAAAAAARAAGVAVVADTGFALDRAWAREAPGWAQDAERAVVLDSVILADAHRPDRDAALRYALLQQLSVVAMVTGSFSGTRTTRRSPSLYRIDGTAGSLPFSLTGVLSDTGTPGLSLDLVGVPVRRTARFRPAGLAEPARFSRFTTEGATTAFPQYENPHRAAWLALHSALTGAGAGTGALPGPSLDDLAAGLDLAARTLG